MQVQMDIEINAPADEAWKVLGEGFGEIAEWDSGLKASSLVGGLKTGGIRTCESSTGFGPFKAGIVQERLVTYDPSSMIFAYEGISGLPGFVGHAGNRWSIHNVDLQHCIVRFVATIEFRGILKTLGPLIGPLMKLLMKADLKRFVKELRYRVEIGRPHPDAMS